MVFNAEGAQPTSPTVNFSSANDPATGVGTTLPVQVSSDGEVTVLNTSAGSVTVNLWQGSWASGAAEPSEGEPIGPQPGLALITTPSTTGQNPTWFEPPIDEDYFLATENDNSVSVHIGSQVVGHYRVTALDESGYVVPSTIEEAFLGYLLVVTPPGIPVTVIPAFEAVDPDDPVVQSLYPEYVPPAVGDDPEAAQTIEEFITDVDTSRAEFIGDSTAVRPTATSPGHASSISATATSNAKVKVPHEYISTYVRNLPKYYFFAPTMANPPRTPWPRGQHDYCSGWKKWFGTPDSFTSSLDYGSAATKVSFKGPCARHDLCIDFKQALDRSFCDTQFRTDLRQNCRYYLRNYTGGDYKRRTNYCYDRAQFYYNRVKGATNGKTDPGHWGWNEVVPTQHTWPYARYNTWQ